MAYIIERIIEGIKTTFTLMYQVKITVPNEWKGIIPETDLLSIMCAILIANVIIAIFFPVKEK